jgi:hypothetical protein
VDKYGRMSVLLRMVASLSVITFGSVSILMVGFGRMQPSHTALDGFADACAGVPQPCWNGIVPGMTTIQEMRAIMAYAGAGIALFDDLTESYVMYFVPPQPSPLCVILFQMDETIIARVQLQICKEADMKIGDLTTALGLPDRLILVPPQNLVYGHIRVSTQGWRDPIVPDSRVSFISLLRPTARRRPLFNWHGFVPEWRYCQLEPEYPLCQ